MSLQDLLHKAVVSEDVYLKALHWIKTKQGQPAILLKRSIQEINVNNYNSTLTKAWEANIDVQFVTNVYSCVMYLASYVCKPEKTLGDVLKAVSASSQHLGPRCAMKNVAYKFLTHREVSAQEAVYRLMSLPLIKGSRQVLFVDTDLPDNRTRLFKPMNLISLLEDEDEDVFMKCLIDRCKARPDSLNDMCFASFASFYRNTSTQPVNDTLNEDVNKESEQLTPDRQITLKDGMGAMTHCIQPAIIRYHQWSAKKEPEKYYHAQLMLYYPWCNEEDDLLGESYKDSYNTKLDVIQKNRQTFEHFAEEVS